MNKQLFQLSSFSSGFSRVFLLGVFVLVSSGCSSVNQSLKEISEWQPEPWVKPYERGNLSRPEMLRDKHKLSSEFREHIYSVRGASKGATGSQGGGCGCN